MAQRQSERETYSGQRRWQEGAGESWTSARGGGFQQWGPHRRPPGETVWQGWPPQQPSQHGGLRALTDELGLTRPGPKGYRRSDERIREDVCERLWQEPHVDVSEVTVDVKDGLVTLEGTVPDRAMKRAIEDIAASCRGVEDIENRIRATGMGASPQGAGIV